MQQLKLKAKHLLLHQRQKQKQPQLHRQQHLEAAAPIATQSAPAAPTSGTDKLTKEQEAENAKVYAGPAVRKLARELGVILSQVKTSGEHGRVVKEDIFAYVKSRLTAPQAAPVAQATLLRLDCRHYLTLLLLVAVK